MNNLEFMECEECRKKPGSPDLCESCVHNRIAIDRLLKKNSKLKKKITAMKAIVDLIIEISDE